MNILKSIIICLALVALKPNTLYAQENITKGQAGKTENTQKNIRRDLLYDAQSHPLTNSIDTSLIHKPANEFPNEPWNGNGTINWDGNYKDFSLGKHIDFGAASQTSVFPSLMTRQSLNMQLTYQYKNLSWVSGINVNKYLYDGAQTQYGVFSNLNLQLSNNLSATLYGQYYGVNPYYSMATFPYINTSEYGGYLSIHDENKGLDLGVKRKYDPYRRRWYTVPIISPYIKVGKINISLPVGDMLYNKLFDDEPNILPIRMPAPAGRPQRPMRK
mgnify:FL=1